MTTHHPREAVIDGMQFVLIREDLLEEVKDMLGEFRSFAMATDLVTLHHFEKLLGVIKHLGEL